MIIGEVVGTIVATRKEERLVGLKFQVVKVLNVDLKPTGQFLIAADAVGAGYGEVVLCAQGSSARLTAKTKDRPIDAVIMGIVDTIEIEGKVVFEKYA
ncbi:MAG TPA: ethanolamine utilization protein EutN [Firmicutes bacterium]|nr:ethanolamine utilization protein EutN [Bacillota bacterium]